MTYAIVKTEKCYRILRDRVIFLDGMHLRFLYDLDQRLIPDLDMIFSYFETLDQFQELVTVGLVTVCPQRLPGTGEVKLIQSDGFLYYGIRASAFRAELTEKGTRFLKELMETELFSECMIEMDKKIADNLFQKEKSHEL